MHPAPLVSVIVPAFNRLSLLRQSISSVVAQTFPDWELVVCDDGSDEPTRNFLRGIESPRIRMVWLEHTGNPASTRNAAIAQARGRYIAFIDSDDVWLPHKLELQLAAMRGCPHRRWSYTAIARINIDGSSADGARMRPWIPHDGNILERLLTIEAVIATPSVVAEKSLIEEAGAFDCEQRFCEDYDLWMRLAMRSEVTVVPTPLASVRVHDSSYSRDRIGVNEDWVRLYGKMSAMTTDLRIRRLCGQQRAARAVRLAQLQARHDQQLARAWSTIFASMAYSWWRPAWWSGILMMLSYRLIPVRLAKAARRIMSC